MMSQHINSMLEHLRVGPLKRVKATTDNDVVNAASSTINQQEQPTQIQIANVSSNSAIGPTTATTLSMKGNGRIPHHSDDVDNKRISVVINETRKRSLKDMPNGVANLIESERKFDPRKRYSISNGDIRDGKSRELSPAPRTLQQRKLSADMRVRCSASQFTDDYLIRRPIRLKSMSTNYETYDSLHVKAIDVSVFNPNTVICHGFLKVSFSLCFGVFEWFIVVLFTHLSTT